MEVLNAIPFEVPLEDLLARLHVAPGSPDARCLEDLVGVLVPAMRPKAVYDVLYVEDRSEEGVHIGGVAFTSRMLRANLDSVERVFPFVATCGTEADEVPIPADDMLAQFWVDTIKGFALKASREFLDAHLKRRYATGQLSTMSPGAGPPGLWPIEQQKELFSVFGDVEALIGVRLTDSFLMIPNKTVSGISFPTQVTFETCRLCPRPRCSGRRAAYDEALSESLGLDTG